MKMTTYHFWKHEITNVTNKASTTSSQAQIHIKMNSYNPSLFINYSLSISLEMINYFKPFINYYWWLCCSSHFGEVESGRRLPSPPLLPLHLSENCEISHISPRLFFDSLSSLPLYPFVFFFLFFSFVNCFHCSCWLIWKSYIFTHCHFFVMNNLMHWWSFNLSFE